MIDKLLEIGIKEDTINILKENELDYLFEININNVIDVINYLKSINIIDIDDLVLSIPDLFFKPKKIIEELFNKKNINELVNLINEDYSNIDLLFET